MDVDVPDIHPIDPCYPYPWIVGRPKPATKTTTYEYTNNQDIRMNKQTYLFIYTCNKDKYPDKCMVL